MKKINGFSKYIAFMIDLLMMALGCIGLLGNYIHSLYFPESIWLSLILLYVIGIGFYFYYQKYQKLPQKICVIIFIVLIILLFVLYPIELQYFIHELQAVIEFDYFLNFNELLPLEFYTRDVFYQIIMLLMGLPIIYFIVSLISNKQLSFFKIIGMILLFMFPVFIQHELSFQESYAFIIFICYEFIITIALKHQQKQYPLKIVIILFLCVMSFIASTYLETNPLFQQESSSVLSQIIDWVSRGQGNPLNVFNQTGMSRDIDGTLPSGNIRLDDSLALTVHSEIPFSSYLRAYSLANYSDNEWHEVSENFENSPSLTMYSEWLMANSIPSITSLQITPQKDYDFQFIPYYFIDQYQQHTVYYDSYIEKTDEQFYSVYSYEDDSQMELEEGVFFVPDNFDETYEEYVYQQYLNVPEELDESLTNLLAENDIDSSSTDIPFAVEQVRELLSRQAEYDLNAGTLPSNQDFVEYFLFENHKGSCTHFATAGALLLREMNIPTRFVRGYTMQESDFHNGEAKIPEYRSHAWIEVYESQKGWIPYEMTPSGHIEGISQILDENAQQNQTNTNTNNPTTTQPEDEPVQNETVDTPTTSQSSSYTYVYMFVVIAGIVVFILMYRYLSTHWLKMKTRHMNTNKKVLIYYKTLLKLSPHHFINDSDLKSIAYKAKYSSHVLTHEEWQHFYHLYKQWIIQYDQSLKWYQKLIFRYLKGYK